MSDDLNYLAHYGVKGMRWGQRRQELRIANERVRTATTDLAVAKAERHVARVNMAKTTAAIAGTSALVAGAAFGTYVVRKHMKTSASSVTKVKKNYDIVLRGKDFVIQSNNPQAVKTTLDAMKGRK